MNITKITPPVFIVLSGKKQTGKDSAATFAAEALESAGKRVVITAFAEQLKEMCIGVLGLQRSLVYGTDADKNTLTHIKWDTMPHYIRVKYEDKNIFIEDPLDLVLRTGFMTVREVLQIVGTDIFREMFEYDIWANSPFRRDWNGYDVVIITDCRFPNEKQVTEQNGGTVIRLERKTNLQDTHISETALDNIHFNRTYVNEGSLEDLKSFVHNLLKELNLI